MPRIRSIKPEIFMSPQVMNVCRDARLLFFGLITQADDHGRASADPRKLKAAIFPGDDDIGGQRVLELQVELESQGLAVFYDGGSHGRLYALPTWTDHQYVQKPKASVYPAPPRRPNGHIPDSSGRVSEVADTHTVGSDGSEGSDGKDLTRARAESEQPVDNSVPRAPAPDGRKNRQGESEEARRRRAEATDLVDRLARQKR